MKSPTLDEIPVLATQIFEWQERIKQQYQAITKIAEQAEEKLQNKQKQLQQ